MSNHKQSMAEHHNPIQSEHLKNHNSILRYSCYWK